jgi:cytochrome b involved in lipid metabolism
MSDMTEEDVVSPPAYSGNGGTGPSFAPSSTLTSAPSGSSTSAGSKVESFTLPDIGQHKSEFDCWQAIHGNVYDLTEYAPTHPGGTSIVTQHCGTDSTEAFAVFHPEKLLELVKNNMVGILSDTSGEDVVSPPANSGNTSAGPGFSPSPGPTSVPSGFSSSAGLFCQEVQCITVEEMQQHGSASDCWMEIHGDVYDLTAYAQVHPGGARVVIDVCGTRATQRYGMFHQQSLLSQVQSDKVGVLSDGSGIVEIPHNTPTMPMPPIYESEDETEEVDESEDEDD